MYSDKPEKSRKHPRAAGFTLVEIMVVVVILGMLAALVTVNAPSIIHNQRVKAAQQNIIRLENAVDMYYTEMGKYPQSLNDLATVQSKNGVKFIKKVPKDPWGNDFVYKIPGQHNEDFSISSYGSDGTEGGDAKATDINSWDVEEENNN